MAKRRSWTLLQRSALFDAHKGICHICGYAIDGVREGFEVEHIIPIAMGGADDETNAAPAHVKCHKSKTKVDVAQIAKANRVRAKHIGAHKKATIPGSKGTGMRRKMDGTVIFIDE